MKLEIETSIVRTHAELKTLWTRLKAEPQAGWDFETAGPNIKWRGKSRPDIMAHRPVGVSVGGKTWSAYIPIAHTDENCPLLAVKAFLQVMLDEAYSRPGWLWAHNLGYELQMSRHLGLNYHSSSRHLRCSAISSWLAGYGNKPALKKCAREILGIDDAVDFAKTFGKDVDLRALPATDVAPYACKDVPLTLLLAERSMDAVRERELEEHFINIDMPVVEISRDMTDFGAITDIPALEALRTQRRLECEQLAAEFAAATEAVVKVKLRQPVPVLDEAGNAVVFKSGKREGQVKTKLDDVLVPVKRGALIGNDREVSRWMYEVLKLWPSKGLERNGNDMFPVAKEQLEHFQELAAAERIPAQAGKLAEMVLEWRRRDKLCSTYLDVLIDQPGMWSDGKLHPSFHVDGTKTQRFSSSQPNWQNLPAHSDDAKAIAGAIQAPPGWTFIIYDYSQLELRLLAHLSQDEAFIEAYTWGDDVHAETLAAIRKLGWAAAERRDAKVVNFSTAYDISPESLAVKMKSTLKQAEASIEGFFLAHPGVSKYHAQAIRFGEQKGYVRTIDGYRFYPDGAPYKNKRKFINYPIQGSAGGLAKKAQIALHDRWLAEGLYGEQVRFAGQIHDSIIACSREDIAGRIAEDMVELMCNQFKLRVPIEVEGGIGRTWKEAK